MNVLGDRDCVEYPAPLGHNHQHVAGSRLALQGPLSQDFHEVSSMRFAALGCLLAAMVTPLVGGEEKVSQALDFKMKSLEGKEVALSKYQGKMILVVNVASR